ncbi:MogA/MoaB family molybdenum cofactor biosynthesis protein [Halovivax cerinus]|uniref:Molybdenum cofactor biosynthesis protein B n=1 Tax=Halovivax cerinus TaxID=1487865 RepID=A0ABD5NIB1_9EURY|nr:molybdopterin-binding protein [Halovivax cerinus]
MDGDETDELAADTEAEDVLADAERDASGVNRREGHADDGRSIGIGVVSIVEGDSADADAPEATLVETVNATGNEIIIRERIAGDFDTVQATVSRLADRDDVDAVFAVGGVGIGPDDATVRAVRQLLDTEMVAFETLVTTRAAAEIGEAVLTIRPLAGVIDCVPVFCVPADAELVDLVLTDVICPQLARVVDLARPSDSTEAEPEANT